MECKVVCRDSVSFFFFSEVVDFYFCSFNEKKGFEEFCDLEILESDSLCEVWSTEKIFS